MEPEELPYSFTYLHVVDRNLAYFGAVDEMLEEMRADHGLVLRRSDETWKFEVLETSLCAAQSARDGTGLFCIGVEGLVSRIDPAEAAEPVDISERGPSYLLGLRCARMIEGKLHVAGMGRMVYRRDAENRWSAIDAGTYDPGGPDEEIEDDDLDDEDIDFDNLEEYTSAACGFLALDGHSLREVYASGLGGEIWSYDGVGWTQHESPTNLTLSTMVIAPDGQVHIAGIGGVYLIGRANNWQVLEQDLHEDDFWGMTVFNGKVYSATQSGIYVYEDGILSAVDLGIEDEVTTSYLDAADGVMWSAGPKHLLRTTDGVVWERFETPLPATE